jgi:hypothetical protein
LELRAMAEQPIVRDFLYLDWERLRSYVAQIERGVPEQVTGGLTSEEADSGEGSVGLKGLLSMGGSTDLRYVRSASETRSLHHSIFNNFESRLEDSGVLLDIDSTYQDELWARSSFADGRLLRVRGLVRLIDYGAILRLLADLEHFLELAHIAQRMNLNNDKELKPDERARKLQQLERTQREESKSWRNMNLARIADGVSSLYGDSVRIKIVPDISRPLHLFVGTADAASFDASLSRTIGLRGRSTSDGWISVVQVVAPAEIEELDLRTGSEMEDAMEQLVVTMDQFSQLASSASFPTVECVPIAIYRIVGSG